MSATVFTSNVTRFSSNNKNVHDPKMKVALKYVPMITLLITNKFAGPVAKFNSQAIEDLYSEGLLALYKAAQDYDPSKQVKFGALAYRYVTNALLSSIDKETRHNNKVEFDSELFENHQEICVENEHKWLYMDIKTSLSILSDRDQDIIYHKTGLTSETKALSTQELADKYHLTTQHVNRIYKKGLALLQEVVRA